MMRVALFRLAGMAREVAGRLRGFWPWVERHPRRDDSQQITQVPYAPPLPQSRRPPYAALRQ